jgi:hypothetical protein
MAECRSEQCQATIVYARPVAGGSLMPIDWPDTLDVKGEPCSHEGDLIVWLDGGQWLYRSAGGCAKCGHKHQGKACTRRGPASCRRIGTAIVRGNWPCDCAPFVPAQLQPGEHRATSHYATCPDAASWRRR